MEISSVFSDIESYKDKYVDFLCDICSFEARAYDIDEINRLNDFVTAFAEKEGFSVTRTKMDKCADFLTVDLNTGNEKGCAFLAHTDTVHKKGAFGEIPVHKHEDKITGPGTIDCKGGIAVSLLMMKALKENGYKKHLRLILTSDEEISNALGGQTEIDYFFDKVKGFPYAIDCETTEKDEVCVSRKGILKYKMEIKGVSGHSGIHYFESKNPILEAAYKTVALEEKSTVGGTTYSCNVVNAGSVVNIIPDSCTLMIDVRVMTPEDLVKAADTVKEIAERSFVEGTSTVLTKLSSRPPMVKNNDTVELFNGLLSVCKKYGLGSLTPIESGGGSDACYTQLAGVPSICGLGASGEFCHTPNEYVSIDTIPLRAKIIAAFMLENN